MIYKRGCVTGKDLIHPQIWEITEGDRVLDLIFLEHAGRMAIATSVRDGIHSDTSLHYWGRAIDLRSRDLTNRQKEDILVALVNQLGDDFDVLLEGRNTPNEHYHIEYDPE